MWPMLLNWTRDECRRKLRKFELEAYSNVLSVFRAQGPLEENRRRLLEELRSVLHISNDRHSAEARRVANDEVLATIAEQLHGPNTEWAWIGEGRRRVPLMPRGIAQTAYAEIADMAAKQAVQENKQIIQKSRLEQDNVFQTQHHTQEKSAPDTSDPMLYPPIVMHDESHKVLEEEENARKRKASESGGEEASPVKNVRNITHNTNQKHVNLAEIYSSFSKTTSVKTMGQSKHSYNQVSKVSSKSSSAPRTNTAKQRTPKQGKRTTQVIISKTKTKKSPEEQKNTQNALHTDYGGPPGSFQASYAQSLQGFNKSEYDEEKQSLASHNSLTESPTMQLLTQPATVPHEIAVNELIHSEEQVTLQAQSTPMTKLSGKPYHLIIKKNKETSIDKSQNSKIHVSDVKVISKPGESIKVLQNRPIVVSHNQTQKLVGTPGKLITTKIIQAPRSQPQNFSSEGKFVVLPTPQKGNVKNIVITSSAVTTPISRSSFNTDKSSISPKTAEEVKTSADVKVAAKTIVVNPKSGQKMVVLPAKGRTKTVDGQTVPLIHLKSMNTPMKILSASSVSGSKKPIVSVAIVSKTNTTTTSTVKFTNYEPIKTANMADIVPPKMPTKVIRSSTTKGNMIVVQKGTPLKTITLPKNNNEISKIIMSKNVNQLMQAANKQGNIEGVQNQGNIILLELNNEQSGNATTMSEIIDSHANPPRHEEKPHQASISEDTPVLFDNSMVDETCNTGSLDSVTAGTCDMMQLEEVSSTTGKDEETKTDLKETESMKDTSSVTDWEIELDSVSTKTKDDDKLNSLHLDLGISSDSETDAYLIKNQKTQPTEEEIQESSNAGEIDLYFNKF